MKIRFRFMKTGRLKYIGHLDLLNIWNRAVKSAGLPVSWSKGFNPHMLLSFAAPLPLGLESVSEYVDIDFEDTLNLDGITEKINARFPEGLEIVGFLVLTEPYKRIASIVTRAEYSIQAPYDVTDEIINRFLSQGPIKVLKKTKRNSEITDISADIFTVTPTGMREFSTILSCGSAKNLKPTLFIEAFNLSAGQGAPIYKFKVTRTEIFADTMPLSTQMCE